MKAQESTKNACDEVISRAKEKYEKILEQQPDYSEDITDLKRYLEDLEKHYNSGDYSYTGRFLTRKQKEEYEKLRNLVIDVLSAKSRYYYGEHGMTITDIMNADSRFEENGWSSSRVTSMLIQLKNEGLVENIKTGKTSYYKIW